jgi:putative ABC transport system permease protein
MEALFGIPMVQIMVVMVGLLLLCLAVVAFIAWRRPVIFKLGVRNIPRRKAQTTLIVVGLMLSTLIITAALGTGDTLNRSVTNSVYELLGPVDELVVASTDGDGEGSDQAAFTETIDESSLELVREMAAGSGDVDAIGGLLIAMSPAVNVGDANPEDVVSLNDLVALEDTVVRTEPLVLLAGIDDSSYNELDGTNDLNGKPVDFAAFIDSDVDANVLLSESGATDLNAAVGDFLVLAINNEPVTVQVGAIAEDSVITGSLDSQGIPAMTMQLSRLQALTGQEGRLSAIGISNTGDDRSGLDRTGAVVELLQPQLAEVDLGINTIKQNFVEEAELLANIFVTFFIVFGLFSIAVGVLLIVLIFTMLAAERRSEMGMERAVGAQRRLLIQQFISEGAGYALLAGLVGVVMGALAVFGIANGMQAAFGDFIDISPFIEPRSMAIAYALGVVITFLTITLASWRVSRLNVVAAVRDIPDAYHATRNRRQLIWGLVMVVVGVLMVLGAQSNRNAFLFLTGGTLIPFGIAAVATYFGWKPRWVLTVAGLYTLIFWLLPADLFETIYGRYEGDIELFLLSGICIVAASTLVIIQNLDWILSGTERLGSRMSGWLPAIRLAVSYPGANKGRTGMTIAMFSLIVFSLMVISVINENFSAAFLGDDAAAGWDVSVETTSTNPVDDLGAALEREGYDTSEIAAIGVLDSVSQATSTQLRNSGDEDWSSFIFEVADESYLENATLSFTGRAEGYDDDQAIIDALINEPDVAVIDSFSLASSAEFGEPEAFRLETATATGAFEAPIVEVRLPDGTINEIRVIGVIDGSISSLFGLYMGPETANTIFSGEGEPMRSWFVRFNDGVDATQAALEIERVLLPVGAQATDIIQELEDNQSSQRSFLYLLQGFMALGLVVGIAAVGVIAFRAVVERRQQIGMLRAIGFQRTTVARAFVIESAVIVILGVLAGGVTGLILSYTLIKSDDFSAGLESTFVVPWPLIIITLATSIAAALLMSWIPARQAAQVLPAEALRYE